MHIPGHDPGPSKLCYICAIIVMMTFINLNMKNTNCIVCNKELSGKQKKYCSIPCKNKNISKVNGNNWDRQRKRAQTIKKDIVILKGGKCIKCGYDNCLQALDLHHRDPSTKSFNITAREMGNMSKEKIYAEADKCDLLCANCHREEHCSNPDFFKPNW